MDALGRPLVLLAALWGAVNTTLSFFTIINERRDRIFELIDRCGEEGCTEISLGPTELYFTNLMPLTLGLMIFLGLVSYVVLSIPEFMGMDPDEKTKMRSVCRMVASLPLFGLFAFIAGGIFDLFMIAPHFRL